MVEQLAASGILMDGFSSVLTWLSLVLLVFKVAVFIDAAFRRGDAYQAVDKQTKTFWLMVLGFGAIIGFLPIPLLGQMLSLIGLVAAIVYLVDVRPRLKAITPQRAGRLGGLGGGRGRLGRTKPKKDERNHMGPYGPW
ncbi:DUF2516 family protein [Streptacidiphilus cavernicola]|uniref:DUF2516 family protein n=1 Tax=Streptacidiphilus cavernicola TaxID=3342716 RepID=A0ABV6W291_9ACTN